MWEASNRGERSLREGESSEGEEGEKKEAMGGRRKEGSLQVGCKEEGSGRGWRRKKETSKRGKGRNLWGGRGGGGGSLQVGKNKETFKVRVRKERSLRRSQRSLPLSGKQVWPWQEAGGHPWLLLSPAEVPPALRQLRAPLGRAPKGRFWTLALAQRLPPHQPVGPACFWRAQPCPGLSWGRVAEDICREG